MLTEYQSEVFNVAIEGNKACIWKYVPVSGFKELKTGRGFTYYEKTVDVKDISELFSVSFIAVMEEKQFAINSIQCDTADIICTNMDYAEANGFQKIERGIWIKRCSIELFEKVIMIKHNEENGRSIEIELKVSELEEYWNKYSKEVNP